MTPCEKLGYKEGDVFEVVVEDSAFPNGSKIRLSEDDRSRDPMFLGVGCKSKDGDDWAYACLDDVKLIETQGTLTTIFESAAEHDAKAKHHSAEHERLMEQARDMLPDGWRLVRDYQPEEDMSDPANWREGDVLECVKEWHSGTEGSLYTVMPFDRPGGSALIEGVMAIQVDDDDGDESSVPHHYFRFHHRPNT